MMFAEVMKVGKTSSAVKERYNAKTYDDIRLRVSKGQKEVIKAHAAARGQSVNGYIVEAVNEKIERDGA